jgi:multisubunit Na+/H+ antiporter MnhC subunit
MLGMSGDPVPQALLITAIVVAFVATAGVTLLLRPRRDRVNDAGLGSAPPTADAGASHE